MEVHDIAASRAHQHSNSEHAVDPDTRLLPSPHREAATTAAAAAPAAAANINAGGPDKVGALERTQLPETDFATSTSLGLSTREFTNRESSDSALTLLTSEMLPVNGAVADSDNGTMQRGNVAARTGPAPVLSEALLRRKQAHSRQASLDLLQREHASLSSVNGGRAYERAASYMAQTQSSLRHASLGSEASMTGSTRRLRQRRSADRDDDDEVSDVASVTSSQWSLRRRRVGPRTLRPVPLPATTVMSERAQRIAARTAETRLQGNPVVVVRGGARVSASRKSSVTTTENSSPHIQPVQRRSLSASGAASASATTVTVSDDDTVELTKSGVSVSLSPITSGARSGRKSLHHARHGSGSGSGSGSASLSVADGELTRSARDAQDEPVPRTVQPVSFDGYGGGAAAAQRKNGLGPDKGGRPPLTPRDDASPHTVGGQRGGSLGAAAAVPATTLTSNTVHRHSSSVDYQQKQQQRLQQPQRRNSAGGSAVATRGPSVASSNGTAVHRITEGRRSGADYDVAVGRKSFGEESMDDTPISVLKERANREAQHNARRAPDQPVVPRLELGEITAKRDRQHRSASYKVAHGGQADDDNDGAADTPVTGGSVLSEVTVSSMTDSATPQGQVLTRSGHRHQRELHPAKEGEDVRVDPSPAASADQRATYNSHGASPAREADAADAVATTVSPSRTTAAEATAHQREGSAAVTTTTNSLNAAPTQGGVTTATTTEDAAAEPAGKAVQPANAPASSASAAAPSQKGVSEPKKRRAFEKSGATAPAQPTPPPAASTKDNAKCCAVM
ncbi:hypothetical protein ABB37_09274 [Leptomonas pyrrhocoris]|uniref:Uncharacterized protein n=1 Tax=Leptomonas pyrrhocoris TaxID=157538 RepID=A0A0N0DRD0_LEPPY|nr:hypothetical protein ABB37_09274 [Leptomonas pyrrhocoris]KPA74272.1 hypothetical protein ABB37_09274 [Leptomonas pyrrhocoris]|eukprot:XP_015652711.1 hypothetical protein ABB37_09274 [Leptomonas pyrrhocoris]